MANAHRNPPFRAEQLGSLLRPAELLAKHSAFEKNELSREELTRIENEFITKIVELQKECGFRAVSDGEYRRAVFWGTFFEELEGMTEIRNPPMDIFRPYVPDIAGFIEKGDKPGQSCLCTGKIKHTGKSTLIGQFEYLKTLVPEDRWGDIKLTMIAPSWYHLRYKDGIAFPKEIYATDEEYFSDISKAISAELDILYEAGLRNVQFDDPNFAYFCSEKMLAGWERDESNTKTAEELLDAYIKCYNDSIEKHASKIHLGLHICRGNFVGSRHFSEGGYDRIAIKLFQNLNVATYYLETLSLALSPRKFPELEDKEKIKARVLQAADIVAKGAGQTREEALKRLGVSPQCGFASHEEGNSLGWEDMKNKLLLVRSIADDIWPGEL
ncbi:hypothetical protein EYC84_008769 [Monilinia fructicola]|uniref:Cobalamin-independent methionine synthase MetE C-terminal/archaeal domain-containing protein n=1 Tax=Monilinia fructicola TaxID=38448 RepID=A0A5M9JBN9_MONFR|nr:hypothetical protein EYC84_008769 [Monilinia fructicola]